MNGTQSLTFDEDQLDLVARRYRKGEGVRELAAAFGCSEAAIRNALKLRGVVARRQRHGLHPKRRAG